MDDIKVVPKGYESSHKFGHSPLAEAIWVCSMDSSQDEQAGTVDDIGWHALFHFEQAEDVKLFDEHPDSSEKSPIVTVPRGTYILIENDQGFVEVVRYEYKSTQVLSDWREIELAESDFWDEAERLEDSARD